jgi:hypothetical protein
MLRKVKRQLTRYVPQCRWCVFCVMYHSVLWWITGSGMFWSRVGGTGLRACVMELYIIC